MNGLLIIFLDELVKNICGHVPRATPEEVVTKLQPSLRNQYFIWRDTNFYSGINTIFRIHLPNPSAFLLDGTIAGAGCFFVVVCVEPSQATDR